MLLIKIYFQIKNVQLYYLKKYIKKDNNYQNKIKLNYI